jgi:hypothetical protein
MALPKFEGKQVIAARVKIAKAGDGLSDALDIEPVALRNGDVVYYVLRGVVSQVNHRPASADLASMLVRQHTIDCTGITTIEPEVAEQMIADAEAAIAAHQEAEREREEREREEAEGIQRLPGVDDADDPEGD